MLLRPHAAPGPAAEPAVADADRLHLTLADGRSVLDFAGSPGILGHRHPRMVEAMRRATAEPAVGEAHDTAAREQVAEQLLETAFAGESWAAGVRFCTTASEAVDLGLALSQTLLGREGLVAREDAYHGASGLARAVSTSPLLRGGLADASGGWRHPPRGAEVRVLPAPFCPAIFERGADRRPQPPGAGAHDHALVNGGRALEGAAAVVSDYGSGSVYPCGAYQDELASLSREAGALWLQDEAVSGFGRTGRWFAFQRGQARPDFVALGKGLTAGYAPGGALVVSASLLERMGNARWVTFSTWRGHTLSLAAISATLTVIDEEGLLAQAARLGEQTGARLREIASAHPSVARIAGEGTLWNIDLSGPEELSPQRWDGNAELPTPAARLRGLAMERGLLVRPLGALGLWFFPSLNLEERELARALDILDDSLTALEADQATG